MNFAQLTTDRIRAGVATVSKAAILPRRLWLAELQHTAPLQCSSGVMHFHRALDQGILGLLQKTKQSSREVGIEGDNSRVVPGGDVALEDGRSHSGAELQDAAFMEFWGDIGINGH